MNNHLHIVAFNVPWPANYGGVIDVFYRIKALHAAGVKIHLHCYTYGRAEAPELEQYCEEVHYYRRDMSPLRLLGRRPFIVSSRRNEELRQRLLADRHPLLLEGLHCCALLEDEEVTRSRVVMVRAHNVETDYYTRLAHAEKRLWRKAYLKSDAAKIGRYEAILKKATAVLAISQGDKEQLECMGCHKVLLVSASHPFDEVTSPTGKGKYALYQGNLAVAENYEAVNYLIDDVFTEGKYPLIVAGNEPPAWLQDKLAKVPGATLVDTPDDETMRRLVAEAQVNILVTHQPTGLKLKLMNALFSGRHCLVNSSMVQGTGLAPLCEVADTAEQMRAKLAVLMNVPFDSNQVEVRKQALQPYLTAAAVEPIVKLIKNV